MGMQLDPGGNLKSFLSKQVTLRLSLGKWEMGNVVGSGIVLLGAIPSRRSNFSRVKPWNVVSPCMQAPDLELKIAQATPAVLDKK